MVAESKPARAPQRNKPERVGSALRRPTILDVAQCAGVAVGTVSRVINGQPNVRDDKRQRVQAAIVELGYVPDIVAQSMCWSASRGPPRSSPAAARCCPA